MKIICPDCHGNGYVNVVDASEAISGYYAIYDQCPKCSSRGEFDIDEEVMESRETQKELGE